MSGPPQELLPRLVTILIPAVGGQGGGVLSEWIVDAALAEGYVAHSTSIPGVAQRTGSTTYYVEIFQGNGEPPTFSLYPVPGALDVLLAPEFLEVGRAIELGFPSPSRTTIIASTHRLYSIHEKISTAGSVYPTDQVMTAARAFSRELHALDTLALAREHGTEPNAVLLGALAASGVLPLTAAAYRKAIERKGIQVATNLKGFELGLEHVTGAGVPGASADAGAVPPARDLSDPLLTPLPESLRPLAAEAVARLIDYQDRAYAARYVERLRPFVEDAHDVELARLIARLLAVWMTYEDAIRVADLKTRAKRFERIRREAVTSDASLVVTDYLKPDLDEIYGILPDRLVTPLARWAERRWPHGRPTLGQHVKTTTVTGYLRLWLLARCRRLRPISYRARLEHERMERWLAAVAQCAAWSSDLAREVAQAAQLVKGYGDVRRRMQATFDDLLGTVMVVAGREHGDRYSAATRLAARYRALALRGPDGETEARSLAQRVLERLSSGDRAGALAALEGP
jgi:indolepyruvate ferredoxin oxidoreductase beta subunit